MILLIADNCAAGYESYRTCCFFTMWLYQCFLLLSLLWWTFAFQNKYKLIQEKLIIDYVDEKVIDIVAAEIYKLNETNTRLNLSIVLKIDLPDECKAYVRACRWSNNDYRTCLVQFGKTFKEGLEMEAFGLQGLYVDSIRPPLIWPLKKEVNYRCLGWSPDSSKFPPNLPEGKWKVELVFGFGNKTNFVLANWYIKLVNNK